MIVVSLANNVNMRISLIMTKITSYHMEGKNYSQKLLCNKFNTKESVLIDSSKLCNSLLPGG